MNNNPTTAASLELVKALEELTKTTGVRIDLSPLQDKRSFVLLRKLRH